MPSTSPLSLQFHLDLFPRASRTGENPAVLIRKEPLRKFPGEYVWRYEAHREPSGREIVRHCSTPGCCSPPPECRLIASAPTPSPGRAMPRARASPVRGEKPSKSLLPYKENLRFIHDKFSQLKLDVVSERDLLSELSKKLK